MNKKFNIIIGLSIVIFALANLSFRSFDNHLRRTIQTDSLRKIYSQPSSQWPKPTIDSGINWQELGILPDSPIAAKKDSLKGVISLGKTLFYDPRLSGSNQISCVSCHAPDMNWVDGRRVSLGHGQARNSRNAPSIENVWFYKHLFWDGRAANLEEQALGPIGSSIEMNMDPQKLPKKLSKIKGYAPLFTAAYGDKNITTARITKALAIYQQTITSRKSDFDFFLAGSKNRMTDQQIMGLHLFRTKARCMNCHNGPLFSDNDFHNLGLTYYKRDKYEDLGRYNVTKNPEDVGKFKTPSLRNVLRTRPWFHNGLFDNIEGVMNMYSAGMPQVKPKADQINDPLFPKTSVHIKRLNLSKIEKDAIVAFLASITTEPWFEQLPEMPK